MGVPKSVRWCAQRSKILTTWNLDGTGEPVDAVFRCGSWRCPECRESVGVVDYARVCGGLEKHERWVYAVLTMPPSDVPIWRRYGVARDAWRSKLRKRVAREYGRIDYVQTWEQQQSGNPHVNVVIRSDALLAHFDALGHSRPKWHPGRRAHVPVPKWRSHFLRMARECGFGKVGWVEEVWAPTSDGDRPRAGLASYLIKLSRSIGVGPLRAKGKLAAELARADVKDQVPVSAPKGFRRLSSSRGLLPPRYKPDTGRTGTLRDYDGKGWTWGDVAAHERRGERRSINIVHELDRLEANGYPVPVWRRHLESGRRSVPSAGKCSRSRASSSTG